MFVISHIWSNRLYLSLIYYLKVTTHHVNWNWDIGLIIWHFLFSIKIIFSFTRKEHSKINVVFLSLSGVIEFFIPSQYHDVDSFHNHAVLGIPEDHIDMHRAERSKLRLWEVCSSKRDWFWCSKTRPIICIFINFALSWNRNYMQSDALALQLPRYLAWKPTVVYTAHPKNYTHCALHISRKFSLWYCYLLNGHSYVRQCLYIEPGDSEALERPLVVCHHKEIH